MQSNYSVIFKGDYEHKQTSDLLNITRYIIVRQKRSRYLILEMNNLNSESLAELKLQIDEYDARGNFLGAFDFSFEKLNIKSGVFVFQEKILLNSACADFFVKITSAKYGKVDYRLGDKGSYSVFDDKKPYMPVKEKQLEPEVVKNGHTANVRKFKSPIFVSLLSLICVLAFIMGTVLHLSAFKKDEQRFILHNIEYEFVDKNKTEGSDLIVTGFAGLGKGEIVINSTLEGYNVIKISKTAASSNPDFIKTLRINGDMEIEEGAFSKCKKLTKVVTNGTKNITANTFANCTKLSEVEIYDADQIGQTAFSGCSSLKKVLVSAVQGELEIGDRAFANCNNIENIEIDQDVKYEGTCDYFYGSCTSGEVSLKLKNFIAKDETTNTVRTIGALFGDNNANIVDLEIESLTNIPSNFCDIAQKTIKSVTIHNLEDRNVSANAFVDCDKLELVSLPLVVTVGSYAFSNTAIKSFDLSMATSIGDHAFYNCNALADVTFGTNVSLNSLSKYTFGGCESLKQVVLPNTVTDIGDGAFEGCKELTSCTMAGVSVIGKQAFKGCEKITSFTFTDEVTEIGDGAFSGTSLISVVVPDNVTQIGSGVFADCSSIKSITIPFIGKTADKYNAKDADYIFGDTLYGLESVTITKAEAVANNAFEGYGNIKEVNLSPYTESIGSYAFSGCNKLRYVELPSSLTYVASTAFNACYKLFEIRNLSSDVYIERGYNVGEFALAVYSEEDERIETVNNSGYEFKHAEDGWYLTDTPRGRALTLPTSIGQNNIKYKIPEYFFNDSDVNSLTITGGAVEVPSSCFNGSAITELYTSSNASFPLSSSLFSDLNDLTTINLSGHTATEIPNEMFSGKSKLKTVVLSDTVSRIGNYAFYACTSLANMNWPYSLTTIGYSAFYNTALKNVAFNSQLKTIGDSSFQDCHSLSAVTFPSSVTNVGHRAFYNTGVTSVSLSGNVTTIGDYAFCNCTSLANVNLSNADNLATIGNSAFYGCYTLTTLTLPSALKEIYGYAFYNCNKLEEVSLPRSLTSIGSYAFANCSALAVVTLPSGMNISNSNVNYLAFSNCNNIYEIYDLRTNKLTKGSSDFGQVAINAIIIHTSLSEPRLQTYTNNGYTYKYSSQICALVNCSYNTNDTITLDGVTINSRYYEVTIIRKTFTNYISKVVIKSGIKAIESNAFGTVNVLEFNGANPTVQSYAFNYVYSFIFDSSLQAMVSDAFRSYSTVYYYGSENEWLNSSYRYNIKTTPTRFYSECIHESGSNLWNYNDNGNINTSYTPYSRSYTPADCEHDGEEIYYCEKCGHWDRTVITALGHDYIDLVCDRCGAVDETQVRLNTLANVQKKVLQITNDETNAFDLFTKSSTIIYIPTGLQEGESATLTIEAKTAVKLTFRCKVEKDVGAFNVVYGKQSYDVNDGQRQFDFDMKEGETVQIIFNKGNKQATGSNTYISTIYVD